MNKTIKVRIVLLAFLLAIFAGCKKTEDVSLVSVGQEQQAETTVVQGLSDDPFTRVPTDLGFDNYLSILKEVCGKEADYGLLYATTAVLCEKNGLAGAGTIDDGKPLSELINADNLYLLDFTLPLFEDKFITAEDAEITRILAKRFCKYVYESYGFEKLKGLSLTSVDDSERVSLKNEWLKSEAVSLIYEPVGCYAFEANENKYKEEYPYVIREQGYNMFFKANDIKELGYAGFMAGYADMHEYAPADLLDAQDKYWKNLDEETIQPVDTYTIFTDADSDLYSGVFEPVNNSIYLYRNWHSAKMVFVHEYIHYIDRYHVSNVDPMVMEAYTEELSTYQCKNYLRSVSSYESERDYFECFGAYNSADNVMDNAMYNDICATAMYMKVKKSWPSVTAAVTEGWTEGKDKILFSEMSYEAASSFYHFLVEKFGAKKVHLSSGTLLEFYSLFEGDYDSLYKEWGDGLVEKYGEHLPEWRAYYFGTE